MTQLKPLIIERKTGISIAPYKAERASQKDIDKGLKAGTLVKIGDGWYRECDAPQTYKTKDMAAESKDSEPETEAPKKTTRKTTKKSD